jgi:aminoglycoside phosphotransferase (APT) family kinase protein
VSVRAIEDGYDFRVLVLDDTWVIRTPRREACAEMLAIEAELLPQLAPTLPVRVPAFEHVGDFAVYRYLEGTPLVDEEGGVREFLTALHAFDAGGLPVPRPDWLEMYNRHAEDFRKLIVPLLDVDERSRAEALFAEIDTLTGFEPSLTHADLGPEHMLCRDGRLVAVIDWGDVRVGDPALDYSWLLNRPFPHWDVDEDLRRRAQIYHRFAPWYEAHFGIFVGRQANLERGLAGIRSRLP